MATSIVSNSTAATFGNSPQKTGEPVDRLKIYSGKALEFDGVTDFLDIGVDLENWLEQDDKTMSVWVRNDGNTSEARIFNVGYNSATSATGFALGIDAGTDNKPFYFLRNTSAGALKVEFGEVQPVGTWYYYVIVQDTSENEAYIYQNGELVSTVSNVGVISQANDLTAKIGKFWANDLSNYFAGALCNLQLWNKAWSANDVTYAYLNPEKLITENSSVTSGITTSDLELWYPMNDTGTTNPQTVVFDAAGTNNTTKNHGTTTFEGDNIVRTTTSDGTDATYVEAYSNNTVAVDSDTIKITYVDSANGALIRLKESSGALTEDLVVGKQYRLTADLKVNAGSSVNWYVVGPDVFLKDGLTETDFTTFSVDFTAVHATSSYLRVNAMGSGEIAFIDNLTVKEIGIATGWTDANQQQYIPQTALMDGCVKKMGTGSYYYVVTCPLSSLSAFSFGMWVHKPIGSGQTMLAGINGTGGSYFQYNGDTSLLVHAQMSGDNMVLSKTGLADDGNWRHIIITVAEDNAIMYVNGASATTDTTVNGTLSSAFTAIGRYSTTAHKAGVIIDEVTKWNKALSSSEVTELYNNGLPFNATKHSASSNLVSYYKNNNLTSDGEVEDLSTNNNHGAVVNTADYIFFQQGITANLCTQGYSNNIVHPSKGSLHLNGSTWVGAYEGDYADIPYDKNIEGDFSVEMWRKLTREFQSDDDGFILGANNTDFISIPNGVLSSGKLNTVYIRTQSGDNKTITMDSSTDGVDLRPSVYEWFHVVLVRESGTYKVYVNGVDLNTGDREVGDSANNFTFRTIAEMTGSGNAATGFIDDLRIYDKALSAAEALKNYKNGKSQHKN